MDNKQLIGHMICNNVDDDFKLENICRCPNYSQEFVDWMNNNLSYWNARKQLPNIENDFLVKLDMDDFLMKENCDSPEEQVKQLEKKLLKKAEDGMFEYFKLESPGIPDDVIRAFIRMYVGFEMTVTREIRNRETIVKVTPCWRPIDLIDFDSDDGKLLDGYFKSQM